MKSYSRFLLAFVCPIAFLLTLVLTTSSCSSVQSAPVANLAAPCALAFAPVNGNSQSAQSIAHWQKKAQTEKSDLANVNLEQLGWQYIESARVQYDSGYLKLAEACAACLEARLQKTTPEALLLRGHALHQMHRFKAAETIAQTLVKTRGLSFDYGLLGDVLMEQGKLTEAIPAYQKMMDLKPNLQAYSRAAHVRWLQGDLSGAIELAQMAAKAGSPQERDATAWAYSRVALYELQAEKITVATNAIHIALELQPNHAPSLFINGKILLAQNKNDEALASLQRAVELNPLPEYQWALIEAYRSCAKNTQADQLTQTLLQKGQQEDPRTFAIYLATTNQQLELAERLSRDELNDRADIFTQDALAWSLLANGKINEAQAAMQKALQLGTKDARLLYHAGMIAARIGNQVAARKYLRQAAAMQKVLLPSEREKLQHEMATICGAKC